MRRRQETVAKARREDTIQRPGRDDDCENHPTHLPTLPPVTHTKVLLHNYRARKTLQTHDF